MTFSESQIVCHRFGLGAQPNELNLVDQTGAKQYLLKQLDDYIPTPQLIADQPHSKQLLADEFEMRKKTQES